METKTIQQTAASVEKQLSLVPNALTRETMEKSARGEEVHECKDAEDLFAKLGIL